MGVQQHVKGVESKCTAVLHNGEGFHNMRRVYGGNRRRVEFAPKKVLAPSPIDQLLLIARTYRYRDTSHVLANA